jgi:cephalosporin-C deacetylase-like acetyl esterase
MNAMELLMVDENPRYIRVSAVALLTLLLATAVPAAAEEKPARAALEFVDVPEQGQVTFSPGESESRVPTQFQLDSHKFEFQSRVLRGGDKYRMHRLTYPSPVTTEVTENNTVYGEYFQPPGDGPFPACVVLHILGGDFLLAETVASHLARNGVAALFVKMPYYGPRRGKNSPKRMVSEDPRQTVAGMTQAVLDIRRATAWLADRSEVDPKRLGITGISLGGIMSALAAAGEPRLENVAVTLGGGNFAEFLWANQTDRAQAFRKKWLAEGGTRESFGEVVNQIDPVTYGHLLRGRHVMMIAAKNDEVIPPACATALWESIGREPELVWIDAGHYTAIKYLPESLVRLDMFFNGKGAKK